MTDRIVTPLWALAVAAPGLLLAGCISVNAPDKPIVIELNVNIKQEVVYRLSADANKTIDNNIAPKAAEKKMAMTDAALKLDDLNKDSYD